MMDGGIHPTLPIKTTRVWNPHRKIDKRFLNKDKPRDIRPAFPTLSAQNKGILR
jgi:hypothetical protein